MKLGVFLFLVVSQVSLASIDVRGKVYDLEADASVALFEISRKETVEEGKKVVEFIFSDKDGKPALVEKFKYGPNAPFETYEYNRFQSNEKASVKVEKDRLIFTHEKDGKKKENTEDLEENTLTRDGVVPFIQSNWTKLVNGDSLKARFVLPDRAETIGFKLRLESEEVIDGKKVLKVLMKPSSIIIAMVAKDIYFFFEKEGEHRLLRADGRTPVLKKSGDDFKNIQGRIDFFYVTAQTKK